MMVTAAAASGYATLATLPGRSVVVVHLLEFPGRRRPGFDICGGGR